MDLPGKIKCIFRPYQNGYSFFIGLLDGFLVRLMAPGQNDRRLALAFACHRRIVAVNGSMQPRNLGKQYL